MKKLKVIASIDKQEMMAEEEKKEKGCSIFCIACEVESC